MKNVGKFLLSLLVASSILLGAVGCDAASAQSSGITATTSKNPVSVSLDEQQDTTTVQEDQAEAERIAAEEAERIAAEEAEKQKAAEEAAKQAEAERVATEEAAQKAAAEQAAAQQETKSKTVYVTNTGEKYHRDGCQYLRKSKIAISLDDAKASGYTACSKCW